MTDKTADRYDRITSSAPINADAARTFGMKGDHEPVTFVPDHMNHWDAPPPTFSAPAGKGHCIGKRYGDLTVRLHRRQRSSAEPLSTALERRDSY